MLLFSPLQSQAFCAKDGWGSPIAGMGGAGAGPGICFHGQSSKSASNSTSMLSSLASLITLVSAMNSIVTRKKSLEEPAILFFVYE